MMIQIERLSGPDAGRTTTHFAEQRVTFGRAAESVVRLAGAHLSRHHGELVFHADQWLLMCHSTNPLRVDRRPVLGGQTIGLAGGETVSIEGQPLFAVALSESGAEASGSAASVAPGSTATGATAMQTTSMPQSAVTPGSSADPAAPVDSAGADAAGQGEGFSRRSKIWIGIGVYLLLVVGAFGVLSGLSAQREAQLGMPRQLPDERIAREIRQPLERVPSEREAARHAAEAQRWYARSDSSPDGLFLTHYHYQLARAYAGLDRGEPLEGGLDQLRFREVEQKLISRMQKQYREAFALAHNREWQAAERALRALLLSYTPPSDQPSEIVDNLERQLRVVTRSKPSQSFR